ncbi:glycosyltransferase family 2 protein [Inmirania thermothiophila]|uniref:Glycosyl transferase family 2 n=1 Tax=Inmirania thermothiophila TaxID=1750597 RepID=A0A3N1XXE9_9GAMM|nr:glycosyltransferase family 2 protein [Inmirania thermothiophila]ROR29607.1 glycosyl transferase family 2 [Inmirania thermothiophila]
MRPITATIITLNEEEHLPACIESVRPVCDEVIVVDSGSTDRTVEVARALGARVLEQPYLGDGPQKAFAVPQARNDWILSIDADERLEEDAVAAIGGLDLDRDDVDAYALRRRSFVGNHWIRAAGFYPDYVVRLYHRGRAGYLPRKAHSRVEARRVVRLQAHLRHLTYRDVAHWVERINALTSYDAWAAYERGRRARPWTPALHAAAALVRKLILKGGILQGMDGWNVAVTTAFHAYVKYWKLLERQRREDGPR